MNSDLALEIHDLHAWYGESHILHGINFKLKKGTCLALLGRNGAGRTTTLRAILGLTSKTHGEIKVNGVNTKGLSTYKIARLGIGYCPEERAIYSSLSCEENLMMPPTLSDLAMSIEEIYEIFPNLYERRKSKGTHLSGGEQQMLALARILRAGARLLFLDEISEGLAPAIVNKLEEVILKLKEKGYTILLVEQNFEFTSGIADFFCVIESGEVIAQYERNNINKQEMKKLLGV